MCLMFWLQLRKISLLTGKKATLWNQCSRISLWCQMVAFRTYVGSCAKEMDLHLWQSRHWTTLSQATWQCYPDGVSALPLSLSNFGNYFWGTNEASSIRNYRDERALRIFWKIFQNFFRCLKTSEKVSKLFNSFYCLFVTEATQFCVTAGSTMI